MRKVFTLTGFRELEAALLELATRDAKRIGNHALKKAAEPIFDAYQAGTTVRSGALLKSEAQGKKLNPRQRRMRGRVPPSVIEIHVGTANPAGHLEEFGSVHNPQPNPALTRAWDAHGGTTALTTIGKELGAGLERAARRKKKGPK